VSPEALPALACDKEGSLRKPEGDPWQLGSEEGRRLIEDFRIGRLAVTALDEEPQRA
jgi:hypothetical protein